MAKKRCAKAAPTMRSRMLDVLNNREVSEYLDRNDVIFLPVGVVEMHGEMPLAAEHVMPLAFAAKLAERVDALVLPSLAYFYAGATSIGQGTVDVSPSAGAAYLKEVCASLLRKGFRRQLLLTAHGPGLVTLQLLVREFFDETKCPLCYLDLGTYFGLAAKEGLPVDFDKMIWGAYHFLGRLDEVQPRPLVGKRKPYPAPTAELQRRKGYVGFLFDDETQHGWWPPKVMTDAERLERAEEGLSHIDRVVDLMKPEALVDALRGQDAFIRDEVLPKYGDRLR